MRAYTDNGEVYPGQIGSEGTPAEWLDALIACMREWVRVLKPSGSIWVNLGDKYGRGTRTTVNGATPKNHLGPNRVPPTGHDKSLLGLPWRFALRCVDELGLILRAEVVWAKVNSLPESVTDRVRRSHETWFHFTVRPRYYAAIDTIREPTSPTPQRTLSLDQRHQLGMRARGGGPDDPVQIGARSTDPVFGHTGKPANPLGKLPGSVWSINEGPSLIRTVLDAVAAGALTPEEGERIWMHASDFYRTLSSDQTAAGSGWDGLTQTDMARPRRVSDGRTGRIESPIVSSSAISPTDSPSTTSAGSATASTPNILNPSHSERTSDEPTPNGPSADTGTTWPMPTSTSHPQASPTRSAAHAPSRGSDVGDSVWSVPSQPLKVPEISPLDGRPLPDHFAAFPFELPRRLIFGWSPSGVCTGCGEGRRPVVQRDYTAPASGGTRSGLTNRPNGQASRFRDGADWNPGFVKRDIQVALTGEVCACTPFTFHVPENPAEKAWTEYHFDQWTPVATTPAVIVDPFGGTGTTALVADVLGRHGVSVDMSHDYCRLAAWRTMDSGERARAMQVDKPEPVPAGQLGLFEAVT